MAGDPGDERISPGLRAVAEALPVRPGMRALETGGGPGAAARWLARHRPGCHVVAIDGSPKAIGQALAAPGRRWPPAGSNPPGRDRGRCAGAGRSAPRPGVAVRVGALDGRHPGIGVRALERCSCRTARGRSKAGRRRQLARCVGNSCENAENGVDQPAYSRFRGRQWPVPPVQVGGAFAGG